MRVRVKLHGAASWSRGVPGGAVDCTLPPGATVRDLLERLARELGDPFRSELAAAGGDIPPGMRLFVNGEPALDTAARLSPATNGEASAMVVLTSPIMGA